MEAVPEVPAWLSTDAKSFLAACFARSARDRCTTTQLLEHPFVALQQAGEAKARWVSPKSTLDAAFWESETEDEEEEEVSESPSERINSLSCSASALPDWDSDEGWTDVLRDSPAASKEAAGVSSRAPSKVLGSPSPAVPADGVAVVGTLSSDEPDAEDEPFGDGIILAADPSADRRQIEACSVSDGDVLSSSHTPCNSNRNRIVAIEKFRFPQNPPRRSDSLSLPFPLCSAPVLIGLE
ncbi:hypothetical protein ZWY2020_020684 [Hordeum vulgare]|nr:hypothetical protein ZWY2020_020684 [Hordeum vulgare]